MRTRLFPLFLFLSGGVHAAIFLVPFSEPPARNVPTIAIELNKAAVVGENPDGLTNRRQEPKSSSITGTAVSGSLNPSVIEVPGPEPEIEPPRAEVPEPTVSFNSAERPLLERSALLASGEPTLMAMPSHAGSAPPVVALTPQPEARTPVAPMTPPSRVLEPASPGSDEIEAYYARVRRRIEETKSYPPLMKRMNVEGWVALEFTISSSGALARVEPLEWSSGARFKSAAVEAIRRAAPFPAPPGGEAVRMRIRLVYELR